MKAQVVQKGLKVLSLNIWDLPLWFVKDRSERVNRIIQYITDQDVDVICLQEAWDIKNRQLVRDALEQRGYHSISHFENYRHFLLFKLHAAGGLTIFSKAPILSSRFVSFNVLYNSAVPEFFAGKGALEAVLDTPYGKLRVVNTHLHDIGWFLESAIRRKQLSKVFELLATADKLPLILAGDLNQHDITNHKEFSELFEQVGFSHPHPAGKLLQPTYRSTNKYVTSGAKGSGSDVRIDYFLIKDLDKLNLTVQSYAPDYVELPLSDHDPVLLMLTPHA